VTKAQQRPIGDRSAVAPAPFHESGAAAPRPSRISEPLGQGKPEVDQVGPHRCTLTAARTKKSPTLSFTTDQGLATETGQRGRSEPACAYAQFMTHGQLRLMFGVVGVLLIAGGVLLAVLSDVGGTWFSGPMIGVGAVVLLLGSFPSIARRNR